MRISDWSSDVCSSDLIAAQRLCRVLEADGLAGAGHLAVNVEPMLFMPRHQRSHALSHRVAEAGMAREGGIGRSEEHTSELQSLMRISYAVFCLKKKIHDQKSHYSRLRERYSCTHNIQPIAKPQ